jgi:hypothetical protein
VAQLAVPVHYNAVTAHLSRSALSAPQGICSLGLAVWLAHLIVILALQLQPALFARPTTLCRLGLVLPAPLPAPLAIPTPLASPAFRGTT